MAKGGNVIFDFDGNTKPIENKMSSLTKSVAKGTIISKVFDKGISAITSSLDGAIKRVDTLNNFPNVMRNLGIGAKESSQVINELSDKLNGLPTTLDDAAGAVQRFTSKNGDVKKSAKMFLAVNNAILAGGAAAPMLAGAAILGGIAIGKTLAKMYAAQVVPDTLNGSANAADVNSADKKNGFYTQCMCIRAEYARIIDDYFSMYGYAVHRLKNVELHTRTNWNYITQSSM